MVFAMLAMALPFAVDCWTAVVIQLISSLMSALLRSVHAVGGFGAVSASLIDLSFPTIPRTIMSNKTTKATPVFILPL